VRDRYEDHQKKLELLRKQGSECAIRDAKEEYVEQEKQAALAYARQEADQAAHLGRMLAQYVSARGLLLNKSQEEIDQWTTAIREEFGVQETWAERFASKVRLNADTWMDRGGSIEPFLARIREDRDVAAREVLQWDKTLKERSEDLAERFAEGGFGRGDNALLRYGEELREMRKRVAQEMQALPSTPLADLEVDETKERLTESLQDMLGRQGNIQDAISEARAAWEQDEAEKRRGWWAKQLQEEEEEYQRQKAAALKGLGDKLVAIENMYGEINDTTRAYVDRQLYEQLRLEAASDARTLEQAQTAWQERRLGGLDDLGYARRMSEIGVEKGARTLAWKEFQGRLDELDDFRKQMAQGLGSAAGLKSIQELREEWEEHFAAPEGVSPALVPSFPEDFFQRKLDAAARTLVLARDDLVRTATQTGLDTHERLETLKDTRPARPADTMQPLGMQYDSLFDMGTTNLNMSAKSVWATVDTLIVEPLTGGTRSAEQGWNNLGKLLSDFNDWRTRLFTPQDPAAEEMIETGLGGRRAHGGMVLSGVPYLWNEPGFRGEMLIPFQDGYVSPAHEVRTRETGGQGGHEVHVYLNGSFNVASPAQQQELLNAIRTTVRTELDDLVNEDITMN